VRVVVVVVCLGRKGVSQICTLAAGCWVGWLVLVTSYQIARSGCVRDYQSAKMDLPTRRDVDCSTMA
jgi:hypothetical protein